MRIQVKAGDTVFRGEFSHSMDAKSRIVMPAKFREALGEKFIVTKGFDSCILAYTLAKWEDIERKAAALSAADPDARKFLRRFVGAAADAEPDGQGRFLIPQSLREHARLQKEVVSIGLIDRIEIWSKESWDYYNTEECVMDKAMQEKIAQVGI